MSGVNSNVIMSGWGNGYHPADETTAHLKSTFLRRIQMLILQFFNGDKKQAEIIGEELFKISEELKPKSRPIPEAFRKLSKLELFCKAIQAHGREATGTHSRRG